MRERVATLRGVPHSVFADVLARITPTKGARELIDAVHAAGGHFGVVSGGFEEVVAPLAASLGIDFYAANRLEVVDGYLTGRVLGRIVTSQVKVECLREWASSLGVPMERTVAIGDGANDIPMMHEAGVGIAFCASRRCASRCRSSSTLPTCRWRSLPWAWPPLREHSRVRGCRSAQ